MVATFPSGGVALGFTPHTSTLLDTHSRMHGRNLSPNMENVRAHGAIGNDIANDTAAFESAFAATGIFGCVYVPQGLYRVDPITLANLEGVKVFGDGRLQSVIKGRTVNQSHVIRYNQARYCSFQDIGIRGNRDPGTPGTDSVAGIIINANSQANSFINVDMFRCRFGWWLTQPVEDADPSQADKNLWINCRAAENDTGLWVASSNGQCQMWLGGDISGNETGVRLSEGSYTQIGGMVQNTPFAGTAYQVDKAAYSINLQNIITEGTVTDLMVSDMHTPAAVVLRDCVLQGIDYTVRTNLTSAIVDAEYCKFNNGLVEMGASSVFYDKHNGYNDGGAYVSTSATTTREETNAAGTTHYWGGNAVRRESVAGHLEFQEIGDPGSAVANGARLCTRDNGAGKTQLIVKFATGVVQVIATEP